MVTEQDGIDPDIERALNQLYESPDLDYKGPMAWDEKDKEKGCALVKDLIAFANGDGGYIIIGVKEDQDHSFRHVGLSDEQLRSWEQTRIANFVGERVEPRIRFTVRQYPYKDMLFVIIRVEPFVDLPHLCVRKCAFELRDMTLYIRNEKNESAPVRTPGDLNRIVERAVRNRHDRLLESFRAILTGAEITASITAREEFEEQLRVADERGKPDYPDQWSHFRGFRRAMWYPSRFDSDRFPLRHLLSALHHASVHYRGWPFLYIAPDHGWPRTFQDGIERAIQWVHPSFPIVRRYQYWRAYASGAFYHLALMREDGEQHEPGKVLWIDETAIYVADALDCMVRLCDALDIHDEDVTVRVSLTGLPRRYLAYADPAMGWNDHGMCGEDTLRWQQTLPVEEWRAGRVDHAADGAAYLLARCNWPEVSRDPLRSIIADHLNRVPR